MFIFLYFAEDHAAHTALGLWVLAGLFSFLLVEKIFPNGSDGDEDQEDEDKQNSKVNKIELAASS